MRKYERPYRYTVQRGADEFGCHCATLRKALKSQDIQPGADSMFSARQIHLALTGNLDAARIREANARAEKLELDVARLRRSVVPVDAVIRAWANVITSCRQVVSGSGLSDTEKRSLLKQLREVTVNEIADAGDDLSTQPDPKR